MYSNFSDWSALGREMMGPGMEVQAIMNRIVSKVTQENLDTASSNWVSSVQFAQKTFNSRSPEDLFRNQLEYMSNVSARSLDCAKNYCQVVADAVADLHSWSEKAVSERS